MLFLSDNGASPYDHGKAEARRVESLLKGASKQGYGLGWAGLTLAEVQSRLTGLPDALLWKIAKLPFDFWNATPNDLMADSAVSPDDERQFWSELPSEVLTSQAVTGDPKVRRSIIVMLQPGVELLVDVEMADAETKPVDLERIPIAAI